MNLIVKTCDKCNGVIPEGENRIQISTSGVSVVICSVECMIDWAIELYDMAEAEEEMKQEKPYEIFYDEQAQPSSTTLSSDTVRQLLNENETVSWDIETTQPPERIAFEGREWTLVGRDVPRDEPRLQTWAEIERSPRTFWQPFTPENANFRLTNPESRDTVIDTPTQPEPVTILNQEDIPF